MNAPGAPARESRLGAIGLVVLLVAVLALGLLVYRARTPDLALEVTSFPREFGDRPFVEIEFFVRSDSDDATVEIVGRDQVVARTLESGLRLEEEEPVACAWDGRDEAGDAVEPGRYRLRVTLPEDEREMVFPTRLNVRVGDLEESGGDLMLEACGQRDGS